MAIPSPGVRRSGSLLARTARAGFTLLVTATLFACGRTPPKLPADLVFVSDRSGAPELYALAARGGEPRRLTSFGEALSEPAVSPDGRRIAVVLDGRIVSFDPDGGDIRVLTLGVDFRDASPAWLPDASGLVVAARRGPADRTDLYLLRPRGSAGQAERRPLTTTPGLEEAQPVVSPDGTSVVFVRDGQLYRLDLDAGRVRRLTSGFRTRRAPRFLPDGRLLVLWSEGKRHGLERLAGDGTRGETLVDGPAYYRDAVPAPDGRSIAATLAYDASAGPMALLRLWHAEEVRLLDASGHDRGVVARAFRRGCHSPRWQAAGGEGGQGLE